MRRIVIAGAVLVAVVVTTTIVSAEAARQNTPDRQNPFSNLFKPPQTATPQTATPQTAPDLRLFAPNLAPPAGSPIAGQPRIVCGMTLVPVNPTFDAAIRKTLPASGSVTPSARTVHPSVCGQSR